MFKTYWAGYAVGFFKSRVMPRVSVAYWRGYFAGKWSTK